MTRAAADVRDWSLVMHLAARHRVRGFVAAHGPDAIASDLKAFRTKITRDAMLQMAATLALGARLSALGIAHRFVKGVGLAQLIYGRLDLKESIDIDVAIPPHRFREVAAMLVQDGYACIYPGGLSADALVAFAAINKETSWRHAATGMLVDLHTGLIDSPTLAPDITGDAAAMTIRVGEHDLITLRRDLLLRYLAIHGAEHSWMRLKWLTDFSALARAVEPEALQAIVDGAGRDRRAMVLALRLATELFGAIPGVVVPPAPGIRSALMHRIAIAAIARPDEQHDASILRNLPLTVMGCLIEDGGPAFLRRLRGYFAHPADRARARFPMLLAWMYPVVRVTERRAKLAPAIHDKGR